MKNCVFDKGCICTALDSRDCEKCSFRKTEKELIEGRAKARERIENLPRKLYDAIMNKYYRLHRFTEIET